MTNQVLLANYLLLLKSTVEVYVHGTLESSNKKVKKELLDHLNNTIRMQERVFQEMVSRNWYTVQNIHTNEIQQTLNQLEEK